MIVLILSIILAYVVGSLPTAYSVGKLLKGIDIREHGSGNVGATNVVRAVGKGAGVFVFVVDFLKGTFAVTIIPLFLSKLILQGEEPMGIVYILSGVSAIVGHIWTCFLNFRGGKGVSTTGGVMAGLSPIVLTIALSIWIIVFFLTRYVSLASLIAGISMPVTALFIGSNINFIIFCGVLCVVGAYSHRSNIRRLINGTENKFVRSEKS